MEPQCQDVINVFPQIISYNSRSWLVIFFLNITSCYCGYTIKPSPSIYGQTFVWSWVDLVIFQNFKWLWWLFSISHVCKVVTLVIKVIDTLVTCALLLWRIHLVMSLLKANYSYCYLSIGFKHDTLFQKIVLRKFN